MSMQPFYQQDLLNHIALLHAIPGDSRQRRGKVALDRLELHLGHPAGVALTLGRVHALSAVRRRHPIYLLPPRPAIDFSGSATLDTLHECIIARGVVDLYGPDGAGKTTLATALVHELNLDHFPDGAVWVKGAVRAPDLLQVLFDGFYESDVPVKITVTNAHNYLRNLRVLVVLDSVELGPQQVDPILDALNEAAILIMGPERTALGRGRAVPYRGLPREEAVALFEQVYARPCSPDDSVAVAQICSLLNNMPLSVSSVAAYGLQANRAPARLLADLSSRKMWAGAGGDLSVGPALEQLVLALDAEDRHLLALIAAFEGTSACCSALGELMNLSSFGLQERVKRLQQLGLVQVLGSNQGAGAPEIRDLLAARLALNSAYHASVRMWLLDDATRQTVVEYYASHLLQGDELPGDELWGLLAAIEHCARGGRLEQLKLLVPAADHGLAQLRWWAQWQHVLDLTRRSAQAGGDRALEAWAMHQLGSLLGALRVGERAFYLLETAANMRQALGDQPGADLSTRNLVVLEQIMPPPSQVAGVTGKAEAAAPETPAEQPQKDRLQPPPAAGTIRHLRIRLALVTASLLLMLGTLTLRYVVGVGQDTDRPPGLTVSWEFGDAWNNLDSASWTQQIRIVAAGSTGEYHYLLDGEPVGEMFQITLPLCEGARGTIQVEAQDGETAQVEFEFDSPYCR